jgi:hypothetical protein
MFEQIDTDSRIGKSKSSAEPQNSKALDIGRCPLNGQLGRAVQTQTLKALLRVSLREVNEQDHYFFCATSDCPVVYFNTTGSQTFRIEHLHERVYQKQATDPEVLVCYCFQYSLGTLQQADKKHKQVILSDIKQGIALNQCACDLRNPQGTCCLGNVSKVLKDQVRPEA